MKNIFRNQKNRIYNFAIVLVSVVSLGFFMQSCDNFEDFNSVDPSTELNIDFEKIGQEHNKGLDYIFEQLKIDQESKSIRLKQENKSITLNSSDSILNFSIIEKASVLFVTMSDYGKGIEKEKISKIISLTSEKISLKSANTNTDHLVLTKSQQYYMNKYKEIIMSMTNDIKPVIKELEKLDAEMILNCTSEEVIPLLAMTSVGKYSLQYWNENLYKWVTLFNPDAKQLESNLVPRLKSGDIEVQTNESEWGWFWNTLESMGQSDGIGAAMGAGAGALVGGVGAIPGAIAGGCYASAGAGIKELFQRWGIW
jgi:hypothetical protein